MIPLSLELTNFLSYRETAVLDFNGIHLACISGRNGAGKSSILDAVTWALFGKSRSKSDDDLVNRLAALDDATAAVTFTFRLEGSVYRIIRRKRVGRTQMLEFQIGDGEEQWKTLSESGVRETQAAIESLLRMNYDTFINASFLLQGQADEFTTKTPNRRKEILAELLGVSQWDQYKEAAAARRKEEEGRLQLREGQLTEIESELAEESEREETLQAAQTELAAISKQLDLQEKLLQQARQTESSLQQQRQMVNNLANNLERARRALANSQQTQQQRQQERDSYQEILAQVETIAADFAAWQEADEQLQAWQERGERFNKLQQEKRPFELALTQERSRLLQQQRELEERAQQVALARSERDAVQALRAAARKEQAALAERLAGLAEQEAAWHEARSALQQMQGERKLLQQQASQLQEKAQQAEKLRQEKEAVSANIITAREQLESLTEELATLAARRDRYHAALAEKDNREAEQPRLRQAMDKHKERIERLSEETGGACPLCGQPLTDEHRREVLAELQTEGEEMGNRYRHNRQQIAALTAELVGLEQQIRRAPQLEREQKAQQQRLAQAEARLQEIENGIKDWETEAAPRLGTLLARLEDERALQAQQHQVQRLAEEVKEKPQVEKAQQAAQKQMATTAARLAEIDRSVKAWEEQGAAALAEVGVRLEAEDFAPEARAGLQRLDAEIDEIGYETEAHQAARAARDLLAEAPQRRERLQQAQAAVKPLEDTLADLAVQIAEQKETVQEVEVQHETAVAHLEELEAGSGDLRMVEDQVFKLREEVSARQRTVGAAQQRLAVLDDLRRRRQVLLEEKTAVLQQIQRLQLLEKACGRDGVQALLIEHALPDIEERANYLLERLTGGEMRVIFDTQRQLKSRQATVETLDIQIADAAGERPYENFSGGEQFRVNFAIRLALSQILAKRAGARLQTLVIDEGFGSQDPNGRQRLVEAINTIQDDFARILVITHIDELRDAFPTRIEVAKSVTGSTLTVV